jgi:lia operon protein LiaF
MKRTVGGVILIALGVMATLQSMQIYNFGLAFWPAVLVLVGGSMIWSSFRHTSWFGLALGLYLGGIGLLDILSRAGVTPYTGHDMAAKGWPLILVAVGLSVLFGKKTWWRWTDHTGGRVRLHAGSHAWGIGDVRYGQERIWQLDRDLDMSRGIGDIKLDLTTAEITDGVHRITVNGGIGDVKIRVPDNVNVSVEVHAGIGDLEVFGDCRSGLGISMQKRISVPESAVEIQIECRHAIGDVRITHGAPTPRTGR